MSEDALKEMSPWTPEQIAATRKLYITVTNDDGEPVYQTWNADEGYKTVTLYLDETDCLPETDARADVQGAVIGKSIWGLDPIALRRERDGVRSSSAPTGILPIPAPLSREEVDRLRAEYSVAALPDATRRMLIATDTHQRLPLEAGDVIVVKSDRPLAEGAAACIRAQLGGVFPNNEVCVIDNGFDLGLNTVLVRINGDLIEEMGDDWSPAVQCRLAKNEDGTYEMQSRRANALEPA